MTYERVFGRSDKKNAQLRRRYTDNFRKRFESENA
jgi:hypothetical protein